MLFRSKASVQGIFGLFNGAGFKITTDRYLTPDEVLIQGVGVEPDEWVYELGDRNLSVGDSGDDVRKIATLLTDLGYYSGGVVDIYSSDLTAAVVKFQTAKGLEADGSASRALLYRVLEQWLNDFPEQELPDLQLEKAISILTEN